MMFRLKRCWLIEGKVVDLWDEIVSGRKTIEYRNSTKYWWRRLLGVNIDGFWASNIRRVAKQNQRDIFFDAAIYEAIPKTGTFTIGYPKNNVPRIEVETAYIVYFYQTDQLGYAFRNVRVITA